MQFLYRQPTVAEYKSLRSTTNWWPTDEEATKIALKNSLFSVLACENDTVVGLGRIVGDGGLYFYIQDVIVHSDFRNKGIGKSLMNELLAYIKKNANPGAFVGLMAAKGLEKYYRAFGFNTRDKDAPGMYFVISST